MLRTSVGQIRIHSDNWLVIHCESDLGRYYRSGFNWHNRYSEIVLSDTKWGPHVSIIRDEITPNPELWKPFHEQEIVFEYEPIYRTNGKHVWFNVNCNKALDIREKLGLPRFPAYNLHLTLGCYHKTGPEDATELILPLSLVDY